MAKRHIIDCGADDKRITIKRKDSRRCNLTFSLTKEDNDVVDSRSLCFVVDTKDLKDAAELDNLCDHGGYPLVLNNEFSVKINEDIDEETSSVYFEVACEAMAENFEIDSEILEGIADYVNKL